MKRKLIALGVFVCFISIEGLGQKLYPSPAFEYSDSIFPNLKYNYIAETRTHDYSSNWDFDGDSLPDSLQFVGNDAVHTYYHLELFLSSKNKKVKYPNCRTDMPLLSPVTYYNLCDSFMPFLAVADFTKNGTTDIYLKLRSSYELDRKKLGLKSDCIIIYFDKGNLVLKDYY